MSRVWFSSELETVAIFWRVLRTDGVTLGFTTHDEDLWLDGVRHAAAPGMVPSAIRRSSGFEADSAEIEGTLSHDSISAADLSSGRFDNARILAGLVDWENGASQTLFRGSIGTVSREDGKFSAELQSRKAELSADRIPRTSPACRAEFCGEGCGLSSGRFSHDGSLLDADPALRSVDLSTAAVLANLVGGKLSWLDGPHAGIAMGIISHSGGTLILDAPLSGSIAPGMRVELREGCDRTLATCSIRFGNAANFQAEPFLPGNDLLTRYPSPNQ